MIDIFYLLPRSNLWSAMQRLKEERKNFRTNAYQINETSARSVDELKQLMENYWRQKTYDKSTKSSNMMVQNELLWKFQS